MLYIFKTLQKTQNKSEKKNIQKMQTINKKHIAKIENCLKNDRESEMKPKKLQKKKKVWALKQSSQKIMKS